MERRSLSEWRDALVARRVSAAELAQAALAAAREAQPALNALISEASDDAILAAAATAQAVIGRRDASPLAGIPFAHKDLFCTRGLRTTAGSRMLDGFVPPYDATVAARLNGAGAVCIGKANMDEFAMGSSNENSHYGAVRNPWDHGRVPGGSSGGSAALVAAGAVPFATGSDTGGSVRQPAAFCGITGIKPTYGRVSRFGMIAYASSLDQAGVLARTAEDCAIVLGAMAGADPNDATCADAPVDDYRARLGDGVAGRKIGVVRELFGAGVDARVAERTREALALLERAGATLVDVSLPSLALAIPAYYVIAPAEASSNLARYDGVRYGARVARPSLRETYEATREAGFSAEVKRRILLGTFVLRKDSYALYYGQAQKVRRLIADDYARAFERCDLVACPTSPVPGFRAGEKLEDPLAMYLADVFTIGANLAGLAAISLPAGLSTATAERPALPIGVQLLAPPLHEPTLFAAAAAHEDATPYHRLRPPFPPAGGRSA